MDIATLTRFFMWCTIINAALFMFWATMCMFAPDLVYSTQRRWFAISREKFDVVIYAFLGAFKIVVLVFNVVPFVVLLIIR